MIQHLLLRSFGHMLSINLTPAVFLIVLVILDNFGSNQKIKPNCSTLSFSTSFRILHFMTLTSPMPMILIMILTLIIEMFVSFFQILIQTKPRAQMAYTVKYSRIAL